MGSLLVVITDIKKNQLMFFRNADLPINKSGSTQWDAAASISI